jgi:hypothetical protein
MESCDAGEIKAAKLSREPIMNTVHEKLSDIDIETIAGQFRDKLNCFLELLVDCSDQWKNLDTIRRQSRLSQLRRQYSPIVDLGKVIADYCLNKHAIDGIDFRALEGLETMKESLEILNPHSPQKSQPWILFCGSIAELNSLLPENLAITRKDVLELIISRNL